MKAQYALDDAGKIYRVEFYELEEQIYSSSLNIKKALRSLKMLKCRILASKEAARKDKFLGSVLVEFQ